MNVQKGRIWRPAFLIPGIPYPEKLWSQILFPAQKQERIMSELLYGSQTFPWQMNVEKYHGQVPHMVKVLKQAGFTGMEAEIVMLGDYYKDWRKLKDVLDEYQITFAAIAVHEPWLLPEETGEERARMDETIEFLKHFPTAKLNLCHVAEDPVRDHRLYEKQKNQMSCIAAIARRAAEQGIVSTYHPNSGDNSVFRYESDYHIMFDTLYKYGIGWTPDVGHMMNGGIDPVRVIRENREIIRHLHFKDMTPDHVWATMGTGIGDFQTIVDFLKETGFAGWIMTEDESPDAVKDSDGVVLADGRYMAKIDGRGC